MTEVPVQLDRPPLVRDSSSLSRRNQIREASQGSLTRRHVIGRVARGACYVSLAVALTPLVALIAYTTSRGIKALSVGFFFHSPVPIGIPGGGIGPAIVGSGIIVGLGICMALPVGLMVAVFLVDAQGPLAATLRFVANVMCGVPSIAIGIFAYALIVVPTGHYSGLTASFAVAVMMLPIVVRADEEAMRTVSDDLWEAGLALGARRSRVIRSVVFRNGLPGIVTGNLLAIARAVGETALLLFTTFGTSLVVSPLRPMAALPLTIFTDGTQPYPSQQTTAWGAAFVLLLCVLLLSIAARLVAGYLTRHSR